MLILQQALEKNEKILTFGKSYLWQKRGRNKVIAAITNLCEGFQTKNFSPISSPQFFFKIFKIFEIFEIFFWKAGASQN